MTGPHLPWVTRSCMVCEAEFAVRPKDTKRFCSNPCRGIAQQKPPRWTCGMCGVAYRRAGLRKGQVSKYCSRACQYSARRTGRTPKPIRLRACVVCSTEFAVRSAALTCSIECKHVVVRRYVIARIERKIGRTEPDKHRCKECSTVFTVSYPHRKRTVFCSVDCSLRAETRTKNRREKLRHIATGGTGLRMADLPPEYIEVVRLYRQLNQELWRTTQWQTTQ